ncbi:MAG: S24 family peptidase [Fibromonadales bacterium]|nr:S24 family peptidase [Fibromonadales bacterium]
MKAKSSENRNLEIEFDYALKVTDASGSYMDKVFKDNDYILLKKQSTAKNGDIVHVQPYEDLPDYKVIKIYKQTKTRITLLSPSDERGFDIVYRLKDKARPVILGVVMGICEDGKCFE